MLTETELLRRVAIDVERKRAHKKKLEKVYKDLNKKR
jgi:hypothetical protein